MVTTLHSMRITSRAKGVGKMVLESLRFRCFWDYFDPLLSENLRLRQHQHEKNKLLQRMTLKQTELRAANRGLVADLVDADEENI